MPPSKRGSDGSFEKPAKQHKTKDTPSQYDDEVQGRLGTETEQTGETSGQSVITKLGICMDKLSKSVDDLCETITELSIADPADLPTVSPELGYGRLMTQAVNLKRETRHLAEEVLEAQMQREKPQTATAPTEEATTSTDKATAASKR